jgi:hypothetical protein
MALPKEVNMSPAEFQELVVQLCCRMKGMDNKERRRMEPCKVFLSDVQHLKEQSEGLE